MHMIIPRSSLEQDIHSVPVRLVRWQKRLLTDMLKNIVKKEKFPKEVLRLSVSHMAVKVSDVQPDSIPVVSLYFRWAKKSIHLLRYNIRQMI